MLLPGYPNLQSKQEQDLLESLIIESIQMHGTDVYYLPKTVINYNKLINEEEFIQFNQALRLECYLNSFEAFEGDGQMLSKFGLDIQDMLTVTVSKKRLKEVTGFSNPRDGDVIYVPLTGSAFRINYSSSTKVFYQLGKLYVHELKLDLFRYNNEVFQTGNAEIDSKYAAFNTNEKSFVLTDKFGEMLETSLGAEIVLGDRLDVTADRFDASETIQDRADEILDMSDLPSFGDLP